MNMAAKRETPVITYTEILAMAGRSIRDEIVKGRQDVAEAANREWAPENAKLAQDYLEATERYVDHQLDRLEAVETLYRIETGTRLGLLEELAKEGGEEP